ncbi:hypothetical protein QVD17_29065 [Tagetes erecta]|uniref:Receptor-like serine/threonine-protein kinase n=1 Tax=Tagetes erecta TaxID=13708 RepID=A0AAD8KHL2_TARER|nr:hypothetical protein QVD17_29065 [Tagetes erecta]
MRVPSICCYCFALFLIFNYYSTTAQLFDYPTANLSTTWTNIETFPYSIDFIDGSTIRTILLRGWFGPRFACGFYCNGACTSYLFAVFIVQTNSGGGITLPAIGFPQVVWSANRDRPVSNGAILNLTATGELVLQDVDGSVVWTTNTTGKFVVGLNLTDDGNLVLFDDSNSIVWQSFDYPTDCLVPGQRLFQGQQLIPSVSSTNWTAQKGLFSLQVTDKGLFAYVGSNPPQVYYNYSVVSGNDTKNKGRRYVRFLNGSLSLFLSSVEPSKPDDVISIKQASSAQYIKLMPDGHLQVFEWQPRWLMVGDLLNGFLSECEYPMACGRYGICSGYKRCTCPISSSSGIDYFRVVNDQQLNLGCSEITPLTCDATQDQALLALENVTTFNILADMERVDIDTCKQACVNNCSCKAALFQYGSNSSVGDCYLPFELFTMMNVNPDVIHRNASAFIKVQNVRSLPSASTSGSPESNLGVILGSTTGSVVFLLGVIGFFIYTIHKRRQDGQMEEEFIGEVPGMPTRFSHEQLETATQNFNKKLGEGGFGAVFEGTLQDDSKIAVKCLEGLGQINKSFLAEVQSIGSIHHMLCGRKNFDRSLPEESWHLLGVLQNCWKQQTLQDMVDKFSEDMQTHGLEVVEMIKVASWCLQYDFTNRPSMSTVVKVLEGVMKVESSLDYNFTDPRHQNTRLEHDKDMTPLMASVLSGPR